MIIKGKYIEVGIWVIANLLLIGSYILHSISIQCEPCMPNQYCPPCQTDYMERFPLIISLVNLSALIYFLIKKQIRLGTEKNN